MEEINQQKIFFTNVYKILKVRKMSIGVFEKELGLGQGYISSHLNGNVRAYFNDIYQIADRLGHPIDRLLNPNFLY